MIIKADNKQVADKFKALEALLVENGAWFHEGLTVVVSEGYMTMEVAGPITPQTVTMKVPQQLLIPLAGANVTTEGNKLACDPDEKILSAVQCDIARTMIDLFNLTDKLKSHQEECTFMKYRETRPLLELLLKAKSDNDQKKVKTDFLRGEVGALSEEEFSCWSFFQSRVAGRANDAGEMHLYFMPIVDCLDHDYRANPFGFKDDVLHIKNAQPFPGTRQCYASYGHYDTLDMFLSHGFIDQDIPYVISVPMELKLTGEKVLKIGNHGVHPTDRDVPQHLEDLKHIMPSLIKETDQTFFVPHLLIPSTVFPRAMRRILQALIKTILGSEASLNSVRDQTHQAEKQIVETNIAFYRNVLAEIEQIEAPIQLKDEVSLVANLQLNKLYKYPYPEV